MSFTSKTPNLSGNLAELAIVQVDKLRQLLVLLEKERVALVNAEIQEILALSEKKSELITELHNLAERQSQYDIGSPTNPLEQQEPNDGSLQSLLDKVRALSKECMEKNQVNGRLVGSAKSSVLAALDVVRNDNVSQLYSNTGICEHEQGKKSLGTA